MRTSSDLHPDRRQINWVHDPQLKGKIVFDSPFTPFKKGLIIVLFISVLIATTAWYFSPQITAMMNENSTAMPMVENTPITPLPAPKLSIAAVAHNNSPIIPATTTPTVDNDDAQRQAMTKKLVARAETQLEKLRLTSPDGDNAYETYQELLPIAPEEAQIILDKVIDWYINKGNAYLKDGRLTDPEEKNAYAIYQKVIEIEPHNERAKTLLTIILDTLYHRAEEQQSQNNITEPAGNNLYETYQQLKIINLTDPKTQELGKKIVTPLLEKADKQMIQQKYTTPEDDNALFTYQEVLALFPDNQTAIAGLNKIVEQYYTFALRNQKKGSTESALEMIEKGLQIDADNEKLLELKVSVSQN